MSHQGAGKKYHGVALKKNLQTIIENAQEEKKAEWEGILKQVETLTAIFFFEEPKLKLNSKFS